MSIRYCFSELLIRMELQEIVELARLLIALMEEFCIGLQPKSVFLKEYLILF